LAHQVKLFESIESLNKLEERVNEYLRKEIPNDMFVDVRYSTEIADNVKYHYAMVVYAFQ